MIGPKTTLELARFRRIICGVSQVEL